MAILRSTVHMHVRMPDGSRKDFISGGKPCDVPNAGGWTSRNEMVAALKDRWRNTHDIEEVQHGVKITPKAGKAQQYDYQTVEFIDSNAS